MRCTCGREMKETELTLRGFTVRGFVCSCGEKAYNPFDVELVRKIVHENVKARKVAHSLVVTVPTPLAKLARIKAGDALKWRLEKNNLILEKG